MRVVRFFMLNWKSIWSDAVWSKVIATAIVAVAVFIGTYLLNWWPIIGNGFIKGFAFAIAKSQLSNWLIALLILLTLPTFILLAAFIKHLYYPDQENNLTWESYTSDVFFGLRWRWSFSGESMSKISVHDKNHSKDFLCCIFRCKNKTLSCIFLF